MEAHANIEKEQKTVFTEKIKWVSKKVGYINKFATFSLGICAHEMFTDWTQKVTQNAHKATQDRAITLFFSGQSFSNFAN